MTPLAAAAKVSARPKGYPDWREIVARSQNWAKRRQGTRARVLMATNIGGHGPVTMMESTIAAALAIRDADVEIILCDGILPGCLKAEFSDLPQPNLIVDRKLPEIICPSCIWRGRTTFEPLGLRVHYLSEWVTDGERAMARRVAESIPVEDIPRFNWEGSRIGEHARAGALRYYARGDLQNERFGEQVLRRYLEASIIASVAYDHFLSSSKFDAAVFHHGLYVPQGEVGEICRKHGVRVVNWFVAYRHNCFIASHDNTYHHTLMSEPVSAWDEMKWDDRQRTSIEDYLKSRWQGTRDWIGFHEKPTEDVVSFTNSVGLDLEKPIVGLLTNVVWDAQLHYPSNAFSSLLEWLFYTIDYFQARPDLQLLIRIHPAEIRGTVPSRQPVSQEIAQRYPNLPPNIFIIPPESPVSTYAAMLMCDSVVIYGTKTGVELTSMGIPTIVAGEAWIKNKGLTLDASTVAEYQQLLQRLPLGKRLDPSIIERAKKYAFHFFFRRMIPLKFMTPADGGLLFKPNIDSVDELLPGKDLGLDVICNGILENAPFIYPAEMAGIHDVAVSGT